MGCQIETHEGRIIVHLDETLTIKDVPSLQSALKEEIARGASRVTFDLTRTKWLDSSAIGLMIAVSNTLATSGEVRIIHASSDILSLLKKMRLLEILHATSDGGEEALHG